MTGRIPRISNVQLDADVQTIRALKGIPDYKPHNPEYSAEAAEAAGLAIDNGIATDAQGRTADPAIWAAGDCASIPGADGRLRLESVGNAIDMAELVAENMLGAAKDYAPKPWFWSDQYGANLQIYGVPAPAHSSRFSVSAACYTF